RLTIEYLRRLNGGVQWDYRIRRFAAGLEAIANTGRMNVGFKSAVRWLRNRHRPEERHYHASIVLAALGRNEVMDNLEHKVYVAFEWLRSARSSSLTNERNALHQSYSRFGCGPAL